MNDPICETNCEHSWNDMEIKLDFPEPDYSHIQFLPSPEGLQTIAPAKSLGENHYLAPLDSNIPYAFTIGAVTFVGVLYIRGDRGRDSYTDGVVGGVVNCIYHLDKDKAKVRCDGLGIRAHLLIDFQRKHAVGWIDTLGVRCCGYRNWGKCDTWNASNQVVLGSW